MAVRPRIVEAEQFEFSFLGGASNSEQPAPWRLEWNRRAAEWCERLALPLNCRVEVRLVRGAILKGKLTVAEDQRFSEDRNRLILMIDGTSFRFGEIDSVVRLD